MTFLMCTIFFLRLYFYILSLLRAKCEEKTQIITENVPLKFYVHIQTCCIRFEIMNMQIV